MSLICLCIVEDIRNNNDILFYTRQLETIAKNHNRGIKFFVDWSEPVISFIQKDSFIINILDCPTSNNCELFLLPDGWYSNGQADEVAFRERMTFLQEVTSVFISRGHGVELYLGQSGTHPEDFFDVTLNNNDLSGYLAKTIGVDGIDDGVHISIIS